jgi:hypothetical protein
MGTEPRDSALAPPSWKTGMALVLVDPSGNGRLAQPLEVPESGVLRWAWGQGGRETWTDALGGWECDSEHLEACGGGLLNVKSSLLWAAWPNPCHQGRISWPVLGSYVFCPHTCDCCFLVVFVFFHLHPLPPPQALES